LFQSAEPVPDGGQGLFELRETRDQERNVRIEARSDLVAQGLNLLLDASGPAARDCELAASLATWFRGIPSIRVQRGDRSLPIPLAGSQRAFGRPRSFMSV
jgi:hypothetical protein